MLDGLIVGEVTFPNPNNMSQYKSKILLARKNDASLHPSVQKDNLEYQLQIHGQNTDHLSTNTNNPYISLQEALEVNSSRNKNYLSNDFARDSLSWAHTILQYVTRQSDVAEILINTYIVYNSTSGQQTVVVDTSKVDANGEAIVQAGGTDQIRVLSYENQKLIVYSVLQGGLIFIAVGDEASHSELALAEIIKHVVSGAKDVCKKMPTDSDTIVKSYGKMNMMLEAILLEEFDFGDPHLVKQRKVLTGKFESIVD